MATKPSFNIEGHVRLEAADAVEDLKLTAYVFGRDGTLLTSGHVDERGNFALTLDLERPTDTHILVAPADSGDPDLLRQSAVYSEMYRAEDWTLNREKTYLLNPRFVVPRATWWWWRPVRVCVDGIIRKLDAATGATCPVTHVKVEVFDVDREFCWWGPIWWDRARLYDTLAIRAEDLLDKYVISRPPFPPDPIGPVSRLNPGDKVALNPQPLPPKEGALIELSPKPDMVRLAGQTPDTHVARALRELSFKQPELPLEQRSGRVGEMRTLAAEEALRLSDLTVTSLLPPWHIFPLCFHSTAKVCETSTDCGGYFKCCFRWWPFHIRRGRLRYDRLPDIIVKVTQTINGVDHVIYMDPYTSTRWNATSAHINLTLTDPSIMCGVDCPPVVPGVRKAFIQQIGPDQVWEINKANGTYTVAAESNGAYGGDGLYVYLNYTNDLQTPLTGKYYYKLSYKEASAPSSTPFTPVATALTPNRASKSAFPYNFVPHFLGPQPSGPAAGLFEVPDMVNFWWDSYVSGVWDTVAATQLAANLTGTYILRLEMFLLVGTTLTLVNNMDYIDHGGNGSGLPPGVPPIVTGDHFDMQVVLDNKPMTYDVLTPAINACGVVKWHSPMTLPFTVQAEQVNGRIHNWTLDYTKGVTTTGGPLDTETYNAGAQTVSEAVNGTPMLADPSTASGLIESTCAFGLRLNGHLHVRNNSGYMRIKENVYALAVERCRDCPEIPAMRAQHPH